MASKEHSKKETRPTETDVRKSKFESKNRQRELMGLSRETSFWEIAAAMRAERRDMLNLAWKEFQAAGKTGWKESDERKAAKKIEVELRDKQYQELQILRNKHKTSYSETLKEISRAQRGESA